MTTPPNAPLARNGQITALWRIERVADRCTILSHDARYRYALQYGTLASGTPYAQFIGLNPSISAELTEDPLMRRCWGYATTWGYQAFVLTNIFAAVAAHPRALKQIAEPIGPDNDLWITAMAEQAERIILCWGNDGIHHYRNEAVVALLRPKYGHKLFVFARTKAGHPKHPLYLPQSATLHLAYKETDGHVHW